MLLVLPSPVSKSLTRAASSLGVKLTLNVLLTASLNSPKDNDDYDGNNDNDSNNNDGDKFTWI